MDWAIELAGRLLQVPFPVAELLLSRYEGCCYRLCFHCCFIRFWLGYVWLIGPNGRNLVSMDDWIKCE